MKTNHFFLPLITLLLVVIFGCGDDKEELSSTLQPSDIIISKHLIDCSDKWLTDGQTLHLNIKELDYSTTASNVNLTSLKIEKDGKSILTVPCKLETPIDIKVDKWNHGENTIKLVAVFKSNDDEVEIEISSFTFIVFNELPKYDIEGFYQGEIKWMASNGEKFYKYWEDVSVNHFLGKSGGGKWIASNGESFQFHYTPQNPTFFINKDVTNFNAEITKEELHWHTFDGPAHLAKGEELTSPVHLYVNFSVSGVHEGIVISDEQTTCFSFIGNPNK